MKKLLPFLFLSVLASCGARNAQNAAPAPELPSLAFDADSAYAYVAAQTNFGPRVPGTESWRQCGDWLVEKLSSFGAQNIAEQTTEVATYTGNKIPIRNISAQFSPELNRRVLLLAHWDTRPWADQELKSENRNRPIDGANDGASGVGVILEIARNLAANEIPVGVDVLFVDGEDSGRRADDKSVEAIDNDDSWCLGTQHWVKEPTLPRQQLQYAVLLDMVGGANAMFHREMHSQYACSSIVNKMWGAARQAGVGNRFPNEVGGAVVDDHVYLMRAGIPAIDIIECNHPETGSFNPTWHTHADNISNIDPSTLQAVGLAVTQLLKNER